MSTTVQTFVDTGATELACKPCAAGGNVPPGRVLHGNI